MSTEVTNPEAVDRIVNAAIRWRRAIAVTKGDPTHDEAYRQAAIELMDAVDVRFMK